MNVTADDLPTLAERARASLRARLFFANLAGAASVLVFLSLSSGPRLAPDAPLWLSGVVSGATLVALVVLGYGAGHAAYGRAVRWAFEGRAPTQEERRDMVRQPWRQASRPLLLWLMAAGLFGMFAALAGADFMTLSRLVWTIVLGGVTVCALAHLLVERSFRPLFAVVFRSDPPPRPRTLGVRMRVLLTWVVGSAVPLAGIALDAIVGDDATPRAALATLAGLCLGGGFIAAMATARSLAEPLDGVRDALARVRDDDLSVGLIVDDGGEVGEVQAGFNQMVEGLRERRQLRDLFGRHVGQQVATNALEHGTGLGGRQADASVVFVDLVGSTAMAEVLPPDEVVATLNDFFDIVVRTIDAEGGWVNKFEGDGALCIFGVPGTQPDHAGRALRAARTLHRALGSLHERHPGLEAGIGVSSGKVVAGNVGTEARYEYTVIGPAVNEAARLTDVAKGRSMKVLASGECVRRAPDEAERWHDVGSAALRGRRAPTALFEPVVDAHATRSR
ncbi:MAG TPA: adenylate/guanylate cyclase domain-containing protein [Acidimicrobiales bacterium]|nr:adenylate/guanylate cyclase domain-containing protein [Acidimicrobiales bacterium]